MIECHCPSWKGIHNIIYEPGNCEAIVRCQQCGQLWYSLLDERMNFDGGHDTLDDYQIPITKEEYHTIVTTRYEDLNLKFLMGRTARVIHTGGIVEITSDVALARCGKKLS